MAPGETTLDQLVTRIVETVQPLRIILFGSAARGTMRPDSDLDVLVVVADGTNPLHTAQAIYRRLPGLGVPADILVVRESDLERHRDNIGLIYRTILHQGSDLYNARTAAWDSSSEARPRPRGSRT